MKTMRSGRRLSWIATFAGLMALTTARAQKPPADLENVVRLYEQEERVLRDRVQTVAAKFKATDELIENRIAGILDSLCSVTDTVESGTRVLQAKEAVFDSLKQNLEFLVRERGGRLAALYQPSTRLSKRELAEDVRRLDRRIEKRVDQVMALLASLPEEQDIQKGFWREADDGGGYEARNPAYTHQQRSLSRAGQLRQRAYDGLKASIAKLERNRVELEQTRHQARTEEGRQFIDEMLQQTNELVARRREQLRAALTQASASVKPLGKAAADALIELAQQEKLDAQRDKTEWMRLKAALDFERERLYNCQRRLTATRQQLQEEPAKSLPPPDTTKVQ